MAKDANSLTGMVIFYIIVAAVVFGIVNVADSFKNYLFSADTPQVLDIDGQSALACHGATVRAEGGWLTGDIFRVDYTDTDGLKHTYRGVRKLRVDDVPKTVKSTLPVNAGYTDREGKDYVVGNVYTWANGWKGKFLSYDNVMGDDGKPVLVDGKPVHTGTNWEPTDEPNNVCTPVRR